MQCNSAPISWILRPRHSILTNVCSGPLQLIKNTRCPCPVSARNTGRNGDTAPDATPTRLRVLKLRVSNKLQEKRRKPVGSTSRPISPRPAFYAVDTVSILKLMALVTIQLPANAGDLPVRAMLFCAMPSFLARRLCVSGGSGDF